MREATGGGVSEVFALPSYQQGANVPKAPNGFVGRGVPDVAVMPIRRRVTTFSWMVSRR